MAPLDGILVADFSRVLAGPLAAMLLGDLGADVVKVERPDGGDDTRAWGPPWREGEATYYLGLNRNKRSIALDLGDPGDVELARTLALRADVLIESFRPGLMARWGLDGDTLRAGGNPGLVSAASISETSTCRPRPVRSRSASAACTPTTASSPHTRSTTAEPTFSGGPPGSPVMLMIPPSAWSRKS